MSLFMTSPISNVLIGDVVFYKIYMQLDITKFSMEVRPLPAGDTARVRGWLDGIKNAQPKDLNALMALVYAEFLLLSQQPDTSQAEFFITTTRALATITGKLTGTASVFDSLHATVKENEALSSRLLEASALPKQLSPTEASEKIVWQDAMLQEQQRTLDTRQATIDEQRGMLAQEQTIIQEQRNVLSQNQRQLQDRQIVCERLQKQVDEQLTYAGRLEKRVELLTQQLEQRDSTILKLTSEAAQIREELDKVAQATGEWRTNLEVAESINRAMAPMDAAWTTVLNVWYEQHANIPAELLADIKSLLASDVRRFRDSFRDCAEQRDQISKEIQSGIRTIKANPDFGVALEKSPLLFSAFQLLERQVIDMVVP